MNSSHPTNIEYLSETVPAEEGSLSKGRRALAVVGSLLVAGGGQLALGRYRRAGVLLGLYAVLSGLGALCGLRSLLIGSFLALLLIRLGGALDAALLEPAPPLPTGKRVGALWAGMLLLLSIEAYALRTLALEAFRIPSGAMIPNLQVGDHVFVDKLARAPQRGGVFVFTLPDGSGRDYIKRVIGIGGDRVEVCGYGSNLVDATVSLNGTELPRERIPGTCEYEDFDEERPENGWRSSPCVAYLERNGAQSYTVIHAARPAGHAPLPPQECRSFLVPADSVFVMGDNRDNSYDSRFWPFGSYVPNTNLKGMAWFVWWSTGSRGIRWGRIFSLIHEAAR